MANNDPEDFASLLAEYDAQSGNDPKGKKRKKEPQVGDMVKARVVSIGRDAVFVDLGGKSDGMVEMTELRDADGKVTVKVGDELEARVVEINGKAGCVVLRRTLGRGADANEGLVQAAELGIPVEGLVAGVIKGGLEVTVAGVRAFCPMSQIDLRHVEDPTTFVGQRLQFRVTRYEPGPRANLVLSRRALLEEAQAVEADKTRARLAVGAVMRGTVTGLKDYGAFVDLGGLEGMLHVSEIGFARVTHPKDVLSIGQTIEVQVLKIERGDDPRRPEKVSLSLKSLEKDSWADIAERVPEGAKLRGIVARVEAFGAFVELFPGVEGLVHLSELGSQKRVRHPRDVVKPGQPVEVTVLAVDGNARRISLSMALSDDNTASSEDRAPVAPSSLGTFGDLFKKKKK